MSTPLFVVTEVYVAWHWLTSNEVAASAGVTLALLDTQLPINIAAKKTIIAR